MRKTLTISLLLSIAIQLQAQPPQNDLAGYWSFDQSSADLTEHMMLVRAQQLSYQPSRNHQPAGAVLFQTGSLLLQQDMGDSLSFNHTQSLSFSFWLKRRFTQPIATPQFMFCHSFQEKLKKAGYAICLNPNQQVEFVFRPTSKSKDISRVTGRKKITDTSWHHVVVTVENGSSIQLFLDDQPDAVMGLPEIRKIELSGDSLFSIGSDESGLLPLQGLLDDFRVYKFPLSAVQRTHLYREGINTNYIIIPLRDQGSASNSCTFMIGVVPGGEKVLFHTGKFAKMKGYTIRIIDRKGQYVESFQVEKQEYFYELKAWGGPGTFFMQVFNENGELENVYKLLLHP